MEQPVKQVQRIASQTGDQIQDIACDNIANTYERKLPKAAIKGLDISISGTVTPTWSTTAPVASGRGMLSDYIEEIEIEDGKGNLRNIKSDDIRRLLKTFIGSDSPALYKKNASVLTSPSVGFIEFGSLTSGQSVAVHESVQIPFEAILAQANFLDTLLQYDGRKENLIRIKTKALSNLSKPSTASDASWTSNLTIRVRPILSGTKGPGKRWRRFSKEENFTSATDRRVVKLDDVENLMGLGLFVNYGQDDTPVNFEEAKSIYFTLKVKKDGAVTTLKPKVSLADLMYENLNKRQQSTMIDGWAYMPLIQGGLLESALANQFEDIDLEISMGSGLSNYSSPGYTVRVMIDEITNS